MAGVRLGYGIGHPGLINVLERLIFAPYHLNALQLAAAESYRSLKPAVAAMAAGIVTERERVSGRMGELKARVYPSRANFVLFEVGDAKATNLGLLDRGIRIRDVSGMPGMGQHLRVTVGTPRQNDLFLAALAESIR